MLAGKSLTALVGLPLFLAALCVSSQATSTIGFGVGAPPRLPVNWNDSFSFVHAELLAESNLSFQFTLGTYPTSFPNAFQLDASLVIKAWLSPFAIYAGTGLTVQERQIAGFWFPYPFMNILAGAQLWFSSYVNLFAEVRSTEPLPPSWTLNPEVLAGGSIALGPSSSRSQRADTDYLWLIVGLGVVALLLYYPRS